ncbi:MAG: site-2 protease family protein [Aquificae bacterium]|nr:site-2 protease family protein [Aquificota bacterium]
MTGGTLQELALSIPALMVAVILHEVAHGWVAYKMGDPTPKEAGRLTLNPLPHIDPVGTLLLPALLMLLGSPILFGWAKPVPVNPANFRDLRKGMFLVSIAGITANFLLAVLFAAANRLLRTLLYEVPPYLAETLVVPLLIFTAKAVLINLVLALFNAVPIPPLDGSKALMSFLSYRYWELFYRYEPYGFLFITLLLVTGVLQRLIYPPLELLYRLLLG